MISRFSAPTIAILLAFAIARLSSLAQDTVEGKAEYETNCMACHLVDTPSVGPSLIRLAQYYPAGKTSEFVAWAKDPKKNDPSLIQMPPMAHVPDDALGRIHNYLLQAVVGLKERKQKFPPYQEPKRSLPYVTRAFLPGASPGSVAVILKEGISVCWDTEACRFRYAWHGSKTRLRAHRRPVDLPDPFYQENAEQLWSFASDVNPQFMGYRLIDGYPEFHYKHGNIEIWEKVSNGPSPGKIERAFTLSGINEAVFLDLSHSGDLVIKSNKGSFDGKVLYLNPEQAKSFTLTLSSE